MLSPGRVLVVAVLTVVSLVVVASAQQPATPVDERVAYEIGSQLRCVVCQNLSVADSPSEMAGQMRALVRERLAAGDTPDQVMQYFVDKYGEWILLSPRRHGFSLLVWVLPIVAVVAGLAIVVALVHHWRRAAAAVQPPRPVDAAMLERIRREMDTES